MRLFVAVVCSAVLMFFDHRDRHLETFRHTLSTFLTPLIYVADLPSEFFFWGGERIMTRDQLSKSNQQLKDEIFILRTQLQKLVALKAENAQLRNLLGTQQKLDGRRLVADIINVATEPGAHEIVINKGSVQGVFVGQAVLDAYGVIGQVISVSSLHSRILLITDSRHAIPVRVERSGERAVALGGGQLNHLSLQYVRSTADIKEGDLLLSSGIGERFPDGYPVASVTKLVTDSNRSYAVVEATTVAHLARTGQVLLIWPDESSDVLNVVDEPEPVTTEATHES
ncbi:rod shape-determining protein MreC [Pleionea sp. CnH1-48]|nr:rod shape-determining protein MreC [Pleionea sp. CnH1-48]